MKKVENNDTVKVHYTGKLTNGQVFDSSRNRQPLEFKVGAGQMIPGFENAVKGMELKENKTITLKPDDAYGQVREDLILEVPKTALPADLKPELGQTLVSTQPDGQKINVVVTEVTGSNIKVDANHPLAGKDLIFDIELIEIS